MNLAAIDPYRGQKMCQDLITRLKDSNPSATEDDILFLCMELSEMAQRRHTRESRGKEGFPSINTFTQGFQLFQREWRLSIENVNPSSFSRRTQEQMVERRYGSVRDRNVTNDETRTNSIRQLYANAGLESGNNQPVIWLKESDGHFILEGWHRTMTLLLLGKPTNINHERVEMDDLYASHPSWRFVKIRAWIAPS